MTFRYISESNKAVKLTAIRGGKWYFTEYLNKEGIVIGSNNSPNHFYDKDGYVPTIQYESFAELKQKHPHIYDCNVSTATISRVEWIKELALSINRADINGIIKVETNAMVELGNRAASRMCPEKHIRFVTEWPLNY